mmetsp:Transcript_18523/g.35810  ORF Transcript_18523/g.35810 Transcript_18523/m.35810 type:complete len:776 (-) Transcript_18523:393-2720(-)
MDLDGAQIKKKVRPGAIELSPDDCAIVVNYEIENAVLGEHGEQIAVDRQANFKKIKVKTLTASSNLQLLAQEIVDKCKLIQASKVGQVQQLLMRLQKRELRMESAENDLDRDQKMLRQRLEAERYQEEQRRKEEMEARAAQDGEDAAFAAANLEDLPDYLEKLYEEMEDKIRATGQIAALARRTENLEVLLTSDNLLSALARVLREDGRKSIDLAINIISVFFSFSHFSQFHQVISEHQVGDMTMRLIDLELKRADERSKGEEGKKIGAAKLEMMTRKQDRLLYVCLYLLLNLAEDVGIERKMKKRNIVVYLVKVLDRRNVELLILATTFLKKLSIYKENKDKMHECKLVDRLAAYVPVSNEVLQNAVLRLLLNLSFDSSMRDDMVENGLIQKVVELMKNPLFQNVSMALLYHISMDDKCKSLFTYTGIIPWLLEYLLQVADLHTAPELISLAVNLTQNQRNAEMMCEGQSFVRLVNRAMETQDPLLFKVVRNISQQDHKMKLMFKSFVEPLLQLLLAPDTTSELLVEVLGTLGNLNIPEFDYFHLVKSHNLMQFLAAHLIPGEVEDDIVLEVVIFVGTLCNDKTSGMIVEAGLVETLFQLMSDKKEDDEMVLQISFTFHRLLLCTPTRDALLHYTQVVFYLVDLLQDKNREVRKTADAALDVIQDVDEEWAVKIRRMKFESYNQEWLAVIENDSAEAYAGERMYMDGEMVDYAGSDEEEYNAFRHMQYGSVEDLGDTTQYWREEDEEYAHAQQMSDTYYGDEMGMMGYGEHEYI